MVGTASAPPVLLGHEWAVESVARSHLAGRGAHAYLLVGPSHVGKFTTALVLSQWLLCGRVPACNACRNCALASRRGHPDLRVLEIPSDRRTIPLRDVHEFTEGIALRPLEASRKVYVIRDAADLSEEGANALLKTLEEPPPAVVVLLTSPSASSVPATIVSRCQVVMLQRLPSERIQRHLTETLGIPADQAAVVARASRGRPGWAIRAVQEEGLLDQRRRRATELLGLLGASRLDRLGYADALAERWSGHADEVRDALEMWADVWRGIMLIQEGLDAPIVDSEVTASMANAAALLARPTVRSSLAMTLETADALERNANSRLALEAYALLLPRLPVKG